MKCSFYYKNVRSALVDRSMTQAIGRGLEQFKETASWLTCISMGNHLFIVK